MKTIGSILDHNRGVGPGFEFLRIVLSISILFTHSFLIAEGERHQFSGPLLGVFHDALVPMFFALSGFLITGSGLRLRLRDFLINRGMRIVPALAVDIAISALIIGPIFTKLPLTNYFSAYEFRAYFANVIGVIHFVLPGVFEQNPFPNTVNGSLWTVPFEIGCYVVMAGLIWFGLLRRKYATMMVCSALSMWIIYALVTRLDWLSFSHPKVHTVLDHFVGARGLGLYIAFMLGSLAFLFRKKLPYHPTLATAAFIVPVVTAAAFTNASTATVCAISSPALVYITVFIGVTRLPKIPGYSRGDYSYGIYLYGYPIQQGLVALVPRLTSPWVHFIVSLPLVTLVAAFSWHFIEKPILGLRKRFSFTAQKGDATVALPITAKEPWKN